MSDVKKELTKYREGNIETFQNVKSKNISDYLAKYKDEISVLVDGVMTPERVVQIATLCIKQNETLGKCTPASIIGAVMQASIMRFEPSNALGLCYFVPYYNNNAKIYECQFQLGYKGMVQLAYRSRQIKEIYGDVVYKADKFIYSHGVDTKLEHIPSDSIDEQDFTDDKITHAYAYVKLENGGFISVVLPRREILKAQKLSKAKSETAIWKIYFAQMAIKTAVRRLYKWLPDEGVARQIVTDGAVLTPENITKNGYDVGTITEPEYSIEFETENED